MLNNEVINKLKIAFEHKYKKFTIKFASKKIVAKIMQHKFTRKLNVEVQAYLMERQHRPPSLSGCLFVLYRSHHNLSSLKIPKLSYNSYLPSPSKFKYQSE